MTAKQVFEATLIELGKTNMPALRLHEFNYLFNKAINQYINKVYNIYDINQQTTDDLRVLKSTVFLTPIKYGTNNSNKTNLPYNAYDSTATTNGSYDGKTNTAVEKNNSVSSYLGKDHSQIASLNGATYEVFLPIDYLHMLNCTCIYYVARKKDCYDAGSYIAVPATRLTADSWSQILTDVYNRPSPMTPYYYIHNQSSSATYPTDPVTTDNNGNYTGGIDLPAGGYEVTDSQGEIATDEKGGSNFQRKFKLNDTKTISLVEKDTAIRVSNPSTVRCEIRYGRDDSLFQLVEVQIDYVKSPQFIRLTQEQMDLTDDTSQIMEFPDYVNQEIINELVHLVMVHNNDPRLGNDIQITQSIAKPTGQQAPQQG